LFIGANLTYPEQELFQGKPELFLNFHNPALCVVAVKNASPKLVKYPVLLPDSAFLRNQTPMTKEEIRAIILTKLRLQPDFIVWDIGAGTGSISVECARFCKFGKVYAIEYKNSALEILEKNKNYFQLANLNIISGTASKMIKNLPLPDCVFIGGTGGEFLEIFRQIKNLNHKIRLVISAVTLESQAEIYPVLKNFSDLEITQVSVSHAKAIKNYHILQENHPILIYSCMIGDT
ncbi:MAG: precorrin-6Y C5,15-methyltransferase (decarboxylating) subunit CbiT, partial [Oscillospiraceae bacterium]|nr:precorrin-6Y C5,15-methyltransferase (decarboxylating) subunit CbiT [Oscillospiraceae bacterium]